MSQAVDGASLLTPAWTQLRYHKVQHALLESPARFRVVPAGRRSGKTIRAKRYWVKRAIKAIGTTSWDDPRFFFAAPTRDQAKQIFWNDLKKLVPRWMMAGDPKETELMIQLIGGPELWVIGLDKPQRIEGRSWDGGVVDEIGNVKKEAWPENIRPSLSDRAGDAWLIGVPEGMNHYYDLNEYALSGQDPDWASFSWFSRDILPPEEIEAAMRELDELTFKQEYEAEFTNFRNRAYYGYKVGQNTAPLSYDERAPLIFCFDFNVDPGVAAVIQDQKLPNGEIGTAVIGEVHIPTNSTTPAVCRKLHHDWGEHDADIYIYGDATGGARGTAQTEGSDWDIIKTFFHRNFQTNDRHVHFRVPDSNPTERSRINAMNARICSLDGTVRFMVDTEYAPHVHKDFMGVRTLEGGSGEIDKKSDSTLSHVSDACGYHVVKEYPIIEGRVGTTEMLM